VIGVSEDIAKRYTDTDLARLFDKFGHHGEVRVIYERPNGDRPSPLPSSRHLSYVSKGWTAVRLWTRRSRQTSRRSSSARTSATTPTSQTRRKRRSSAVGLRDGRRPVASISS